MPKINLIYIKETSVYTVRPSNSLIPACIVDVNAAHLSDSDERTISADENTTTASECGESDDSDTNSTAVTEIMIKNQNLKEKDLKSSNREAMENICQLKTKKEISNDDKPTQLSENIKEKHMLASDHNDCSISAHKSDKTTSVPFSISTEPALSDTNQITVRKEKSDNEKSAGQLSENIAEKQILATNYDCSTSAQKSDKTTPVPSLISTKPALSDTNQITVKKEKLENEKSTGQLSENIAEKQILATNYNDCSTSAQKSDKTKPVPSLISTEPALSDTNQITVKKEKSDNEKSTGQLSEIIAEKQILATNYNDCSTSAQKSDKSTPNSCFTPTEPAMEDIQIKVEKEISSTGDCSTLALKVDKTSSNSSLKLTEPAMKEDEIKVKKEISSTDVCSTSALKIDQTTPDNVFPTPVPEPCVSNKLLKYINLNIQFTCDDLLDCLSYLDDNFEKFNLKDPKTIVENGDFINSPENKRVKVFPSNTELKEIINKVSLLNSSSDIGNIPNASSSIDRDSKNSNEVSETMTINDPATVENSINSKILMEEQTDNGKLKEKPANIKKLETSLADNTASPLENVTKQTVLERVLNEKALEKFEIDIILPKRKATDNIEPKRKATDILVPERKATDYALPELGKTDNSAPKLVKIDYTEPKLKTIYNTVPKPKRTDNTAPKLKTADPVVQKKKTIDSIAPGKKSNDNIAPEMKIYYDTNPERNAMLCEPSQKDSQILDKLLVVVYNEQSGRKMSENKFSRTRVAPETSKRFTEDSVQTESMRQSNEKEEIQILEELPMHEAKSDCFVRKRKVLFQAENPGKKIKLEKNCEIAKCIPGQCVKCEQNSRNLQSLRQDSFKRILADTCEQADCSCKKYGENMFEGDFGGRKGTRESLSKCLFKHVGRYFIGVNDLPTLILEWNPSWLLIQKEFKKFAPICSNYRKIKIKYADESDYYNTYFPLHLLSIWLRISESWENEPPSFDSVVENQIEKPNFVKVTCSTVLSIEIFPEWPKREDIILCKFTKPNGHLESIFGRVCNVMAKDYDPPFESNLQDKAEVLKRVKFEFFCAEALDITFSEKMKVQILCNVRIALMQNDALQHLNNTMKDLIIDPVENLSRMSFMYLPSDLHPMFHRSLQNIVNSMISPDNLVTLVDTSSPCDVMSAISQLVISFMKKNIPVLIGVRSEESFFRLAYLLKRYNLILAIKKKEIKIPEELGKFSLEDHLSIVPSREIFNKWYVTLTLMSSMYFQDSATFAEQKLVCIVHDAHLCTETETALLIYYDIKNLILMGNTEKGSMHPLLEQYSYNMSLYSRLNEVK